MWNLIKTLKQDKELNLYKIKCKSVNFFDKTPTDDLDETVVGRLKDKNIQDLAEKNVTFFYDQVTNLSYRIEIVEKKGKRDIIVGVVPTGLGRYK